MNPETKTMLAAVTVLAVAAGVVLATQPETVRIDDDDQTPITGPALERASAAALAYTGGGRVTETEVGDEESEYEVEVTFDDGSQVDVQLDEDFNVVAIESDDEDDG